jgi:amino acid permease
MKSRVREAAAYVAHGVCEPYDGDKSPEAHGRLTDTAAVLHLLTGVLSSGVAALPYAFRSSGCALGALLLIGCTLAAVASAQLLFEAAHLTGALTYTSLASISLGKRAGLFTGACIAAVQFGGVVACVNVLADLLSTWAGQDLPAGAEPSRVPVMVALAGLALLSLVLGLRSQRGMHMLTLTGTSFVLAFPLALFTHALSRPRDVALDAGLGMWRPEGAAVGLSVISYGLGNSHGSLLFSISASLRPERQAPVVALSLVAAAAVYGIVGVGGYATFREATQGDVLRNFGHGAGGGGGARVARVMAQALRLGYGLSVSSAVPLALMPLRDALTPLAAAAAKHCSHSAPGEAGKQLMESAITAALLLAVLCSALLLPNLEFVAALVGATCCVLLSSVIPAAISLRVAATHPVRGGRRASSTAARAFLLVAGLLASGLCTRATLSAVVQEQEAVALAKVMVRAEQTVEVKTQRLTAAVAAVNTLSAVEDAAAQLSHAQGEADVALGRAQSATATAAAKSKAKGSRATRPDPVASAGELEDAAAALASARSKVEFRLASVVGAMDALEDLKKASSNITRPPTSKGGSSRASGLLSPPAAQNRGALQEATNNTVAAVQHTAAALAVAQQAVNAAAGALVGGAGRGTGVSAAGVNVAAAAASAASRSSNDTLASLHAMAATQAVELEAELVDALQEVQAEVMGEQQTGAGGKHQAVAGATAGGILSSKVAVGNTTTAAQAAVQAVARTTVAGASAVVRALARLSPFVCLFVGLLRTRFRR